MPIFLNIAKFSNVSHYWSISQIFQCLSILQYFPIFSNISQYSHIFLNILIFSHIFRITIFSNIPHSPKISNSRPPRPSQINIPPLQYLSPLNPLIKHQIRISAEHFRQTTPLNNSIRCKNPLIFPISPPVANKMAGIDPAPMFDNPRNSIFEFPAALPEPQNRKCGFSKSFPRLGKRKRVQNENFREQNNVISLNGRT